MNLSDCIFSSLPQQFLSFMSLAYLFLNEKSFVNSGRTLLGLSSFFTRGHKKGHCAHSPEDLKLAPVADDHSQMKRCLTVVMYDAAKQPNNP